MVRTLPLENETRLDLSRILAIAAAIAVHAFAFLLLLVPLATGPQEIMVQPKQPPWQIPITIPIPPVAPVEPTHTQPTPTQHVVPRAAVQPPRISASAVDQGTLPAVTEGPAIDTVVKPIAIDTSPMQMGGDLQYANAPAPVYPRDAARAGVQGTVLLKILVDIDGSPLQVIVDRSSGNRSLDRAAREHVLKTWQFEPAMRNGQAVQAYGLVPIVFSMQ